nr:MAG TPA: hypothetical protein [Caudoviricetes sp.]
MYWLWLNNAILFCTKTSQKCREFILVQCVI